MTLVQALKKIPSSDGAGIHAQAMIRMLESGYEVADVDALFQLWRISWREAMEFFFEVNGHTLGPMTGLHLDLTAGKQIAALRSSYGKEAPFIAFIVHELSQSIECIHLVSSNSKPEHIETPIRNL